jgi:hypothetical protein
MTTSRDRLEAWGPTVVATAAAVVYVLRAPGVAAGVHRGAAPPLWQVLAELASLAPVGDHAFRLQLLSATCAAVAVLWTARLVLDAAAERDAAAGWGAVSAGGLCAVAVIFAAMTIGPWTLELAALAGASRLLVRAAAGEGAPAGLGLVIALALGAATGPVFLALVPVGGALLAVRLYRGARFPLAAPLLAAIVVGGMAIVTLIRGSASEPPLPLEGRLSALLSLTSDSLGPFGLIAAVAGFVALWRRRRTFWLAAALTTIGALATARVLRAPVPDPAPLLWAASACAGIGVAALVRLTGRFAIAAGAGAALLVIAPAAVLSLI